MYFASVSRLLIFSVFLLSGFAAAPTSADWDSCHDELDRMRKIAAEASDAAENAHSQQDDYEECKRFPEIHDLWHDGCRSKRRDYESAASDAESKLDDLDTRLSRVQESCSYEFTLNRMSRTDAAQYHLCTSYRRLAQSVGRDNALQMCGKNMSTEWCASCLIVK